MNTNKFLMGGIIGGIANFFLGWLVWGILLMDLMTKHTSSGALGIFRSSDKMIWWAMIVGNLAHGFLLAYILLKGNVRTAVGGFVTGATVGLLSSIGYNCIMYAQMKVYGMYAIAIDVAATLIVAGIIGAILGWFFGRGSNAS